MMRLYNFLRRLFHPKLLYLALGIDLSGRKDILGLWITENESAKFWHNNWENLIIFLQ